MVSTLVWYLKMKIREIISETGTSGGTTSVSISSVANPHLSPGTARGNKYYIGSPGHSGTKSPPHPKVIQPTTASGIAKNALDITDVSLFGGPANESTVIKR